jgi:hypothetical protein
VNCTNRKNIFVFFFVVWGFLFKFAASKKENVYETVFIGQPDGAEHIWGPGRREETGFSDVYRREGEPDHPCEEPVSQRHMLGLCDNGIL